VGWWHKSCTGCKGFRRWCVLSPTKHSSDIDMQNQAEGSKAKELGWRKKMQRDMYMSQGPFIALRIHCITNFCCGCSVSSWSFWCGTKGHSFIQHLSLLPHLYWVSSKKKKCQDKGKAVEESANPFSTLIQFAFIIVFAQWVLL
jgi:hypothetical protein